VDASAVEPPRLDLEEELDATLFFCRAHALRGDADTEAGELLLR